MVKILVGIIEDEERGMSMLKGMLSHYFDNIEIVATAMNIPDGKKMLDTHTLDVLFLDIHLAGGNAFDLLKIVKIDCDIVFTTAYEEYAHKAFNVKALHYLLKPIMLDDIKVAIERHLEKRMLQQRYIDEAEEFNEIQNLNKEKLALPTPEGTCYVDIKQIVRIQSANRYTVIYIPDAHYVVTKPLYYFEEEFRGYPFSRIHDSHLINLAYFQAYHKGRGGEVELFGGELLEVSSRRKQSFLKDLAEFKQLK